MFPLSGNKSCCLIFIKSIVYFEEKFALPVQTSYSDNAGFKIISLSFARKSKHLEWNSPLVTLSLHVRGRVVTKERNFKNFHAFRQYL